ncbi:TraR/DksA C4-type zinc finger protein [Amycolatopsis acidiphila]|uniref:TraR/DksA family transcriptional regulator n=1 Tax=Amycolatopsis acidiphila TaxID=715473 RepID=UPI001E64D6B9|nr:TraR/DksA C4-type zinc finger protein [Amycolatopsis acidiphila]UIJ62759.1 TraR/DksA C4-type zinc finger protein [Amycolatopsis acidiphila]
MDERTAIESIERARAETLRLVDALTRQRDAIVEASAFTSNDDEHDPEGATIAFERAQVLAMLRQAQDDLADLDRATQRVRAGSYGECERCGGPIADGRLAARPAARTCIKCAR